MSDTTIEEEIDSVLCGMADDLDYFDHVFSSINLDTVLDRNGYIIIINKDTNERWLFEE